MIPRLEAYSVRVSVVNDGGLKTAALLCRQRCQADHRHRDRAPITFVTITLTEPIMRHDAASLSLPGTGAASP